MSRPGSNPDRRRGGVTLQTRLILLVILIVGTVLVVSTSVSLWSTAKGLDADIKEQGLAAAQAVAAGVASVRELDDPLFLQREVAEMRSRRHARRIAVFALKPQGLVTVVTSDPTAAETLLVVAQRSVREGGTVAMRDVTEKGRVWNVAAPIMSGQAVVGVVAVEVSLRRVENWAARFRQQSLALMAGAVLVIIGFLAWHLQRTVTRPIRDLVSTMSRAEQGDLEVKAEVGRQDELGQLAESLNRMLERIANFNEELRRKVEQATRELTERNGELSRVNARLFELQRELFRSNRLATVGQLAAMVAHEVATPLNAVSGHLEILLQEEGKNERALHRLRIVESQIGRVVEILQRILTVSNMTDGERRPVDPNALLRELIELTAPAFEKKGVKVSLELDSSSPSVHGDPRQLQQACLNLIVNGLEAMAEGGRLTITTRRVVGSWPEVHTPRTVPTGSEVGDRSGNAFVEISVSDTGSGIPAEHLAHIFEPFFTTKDIGRGTGLGLAVSQRIVKAHGGAITVASEVGQGGTFTIRLPAAPT